MHHIFDWIARHSLDSIPTLVSTLIGALVGGLFVLWGQNRADKQQRKREANSEEQSLVGVLNALHAELEGVNRAILSPPDPFKLVPINQDYFVVFNANASLIGRLQDTDLTEQIIRLYSTSKYLVDLINHHQTKYGTVNDYRNMGVVRSLERIEAVTGEVKLSSKEVQRKIKAWVSRRVLNASAPSRSTVMGDVPWSSG